MGKHPTTVEGFQGSLDELARAVGNMTYDQTASFLERLADDLKRQADADAARGRKKLSDALYATADELYKAKAEMDAAWKVCEPYMQEETGEGPKRG